MTHPPGTSRMRVPCLPKGATSQFYEVRDGGILLVPGCEIPAASTASGHSICYSLIGENRIK
jgi:hypothetical protein